MTPPKRELVLRSVDTTDNVGLGIRPNRDHRPRDYAKIWEGARELQHHECLPRRPSCCPHSQENRPAPYDGTRRQAPQRPPPGAALQKPRSQPNPSPSGARAARTQQASPAATRVVPAQIRADRRGLGPRTAQRSAIAVDRPLVRSSLRLTHGQIWRRAGDQAWANERTSTRRHR